MSKENETLVMEALRHAHGDVSIYKKYLHIYIKTTFFWNVKEFELNDRSTYQDKGGGIMKQYWVTRSTLIVQGGIDYSNKERNTVQNQISAFALKKLER